MSDNPARWQSRSKDMFVRCRRPSVILRTLVTIGELGAHYPELAALIGVPQNPQWHPEGDVWRHTLMVADIAQEIIERDSIVGEMREVVALGALCHDFGKPATTQLIDGRWKSPRHSEAGEVPTRSFLTRLNVAESVIEKVVKIIREHLWPNMIFGHRDGRKEKISDTAIRRLLARLRPATIEELLAVAEADIRGRMGGPEEMPWLNELHWRVCLIREEDADAEPTPLINGDDLIEMGFKPGPEFRVILDRAYELQLAGKVTSNAEAREAVISIAEVMDMLRSGKKGEDA